MRMANTKNFFIITGEPGVGKTTLIKKLVTSLKSANVKTYGFYTEEVRRNGSREGFDVVTLDGVRGRLARDKTLLNGPVKHKVGKYGVLVQDFEAIALPCLEKLVYTPPHILVIDEIGKMEFFSAPFKSKIKDIFSQSSNSIVLATIPSRKSDPLVEKLRNAEASEVWIVRIYNINQLDAKLSKAEFLILCIMNGVQKVTKENRNNIKEAILKEIKVTLKIT